MSEKYLVLKENNGGKLSLLSSSPFAALLSLTGKGTL